MGTMIHLAVGNMQIDWGKNEGYMDHSVLFQPTDLAQVPSYYGGENTDDLVNHPDGFVTIVEYQVGLSKRLKEVGERLFLLGYTDKYSQAEFNYFADYNLYEEDDREQKITFEKLKLALETMDSSMLSLDQGKHDLHNRHFKIELYKKLGLDIYIENPHMLENIGNEDDFISPYSLMKLLSKNETAMNLPVMWDFADHESSGWGTREDYVKEPSQTNKFLIVTEGTSDSLILKHALSILKPHIADFFDFVDMQDGYPFSGTGNLINFVKGLISIKVQNNVIVLFDNDAEGVVSYNKCLAMNVPSNMRILKLPNIEEFKKFKTVGATGEHISDINGSAAAIECYLDLNNEGVVRWNNYNSTLRIYQGELVEKDKYKKEFLSLKTFSDDYDYSKLLRIIEMINENCSNIKEQFLIGKIKHPEESY